MSRALPISAAWLRERRAVSLWTAAGTLFVFTGLVRLIGLGRSSDVTDDEIYYWRLGHSVYSGGFPRFHGQLFFLHPPGFFYLESGWERLFGARSDVVAGIYEMRVLNALLASITAAALAVLVARLTRSVLAASAAGLIFALDPFVLRINEHVLIETSAMLWVVLGYLVLMPLTEEEPPPRARRRAAAAGLLFGMAVLTKDVSALVTVLPMLAAALFVWPHRRSLPLITAGVATVPYACYLAVIAGRGYFAGFWWTKTYGLRRLLGHLQETGFNAKGAPSLHQRLTEQVFQFGSTYLLLALGPLALVLLLRAGGRSRRLMALWYLAAAVTLAYAVTKGTLEEQELYILLLPTMVIVTAVAARLVQQRSGHGRRALARRLGAAIAAALVVASSSAAYAGTRSHPDDGYARLRQYMLRHVPEGAPVTSASGSADLVLEDHYHMGRWLTSAGRAQAGVAYAVVPWGLVEQGYSPFSQGQAKNLTRQGVLLFSFHDRTYGTVALYRLPVPPTAGGNHG